MTNNNIILESVDDELEHAFDIMRAKMNKLSMPDDEKNKALQTVMDAINKDPHNRDAFIDDPCKFSNSVLPFDLFEEVVPNPEETEKEHENNLTKISQLGYGAIVNEFKLRFRNNPQEADNLAGFLLKILNGRGSNAEGWRKYLDDRCNKGKNKAVVQNKLIPTLVNAYNTRNESKKIELPRQVNDDQRSNISDRNGKSVGSIVIPEGFNQSPISLGNQVISMDFGYPAINFKSELILEILREANNDTPDKKRLKQLLDALINRINGTPAGKAMLKSSIWKTRTRSRLKNLIKNAASAQGIPMIRRTLKVLSKDLIDSQDNYNITVIPLNAVAEPTNEALDVLDYDPLFEGFGFSIKSERAQHVFDNPVEIPAAYIKQFYTILPPSGPTGLHLYARYMSTSEKNELEEQLGQEAIEEIKTGNRSVNDMILQKYIEMKGGVPPFYLLVPRKADKERLRVCKDLVIGNKICIKSIDPRNKDAYFFDISKVGSLFEVG